MGGLVGGTGAAAAGALWLQHAGYRGAVQIAKHATLPALSEWLQPRSPNTSACCSTGTDRLAWRAAAGPG